jgi:hypothetical protein
MTYFYHTYKTTFASIVKQFLTICAWGLFCFSTLTSAFDGNVGKPFEDRLCLQVKFAQGQPLQDLEMLKPLGVKWVREEIAWSTIEPRKGAYQPLPESLKTRLNFYRANDIGVIFIMAYENAVAYPNSAEAPNDFVNPYAFARFTEYMARQKRISWW